MDTRKFLIMSDVHVRNRTWTNNTILSGDCYTALDTIAERTRDIADTVLIAGDWFDTNRPTSTDLEQTFRFLSNYRHVRFIRGNHDSVDPSFLMSGSAVLSDDIDIAPLSDETMAGVGLHGIDWDPVHAHVVDRLSEISNAIGNSTETLHVVLVHTGLKELLGIDGAYDMQASDLSSMLGHDGKRVVVVAGHIHVDRHFDDGGVLFLSPGSIYANNSMEMDHSFNVHLMDACGELSHVPCGVRNYFSMQAADAASVPGIEKRLLELSRSDAGILTPFVRLWLPADYTGSPTIPEGVLAQLHRDVAETGMQTQAAADAYSMSDAVSTECGDDPDMRDMCLALMASDDPVVMLSSWLDEWGAELLK